MSDVYANVKEDKLEMDFKMNNDGQNLKLGRKFKAAEVSLKALCFILLVVILALVANNHSAISSWSQYQIRPDDIENLTSIVMELQAKINNFTEMKLETERKSGFCPLRWIEVNRECLYVSPKTVSKNWANSQRDCEDLGGRLVTIKNNVKLQALGLFHNLAWIGLSDRETEGSWKWEDGTDFESGFWMKGEPNDHNSNEDCAHLTVKGANVGFNDNNCDKSLPYICEASG